MSGEGTMEKGTSNEYLANLQPASIEEELQKGKDRNIEVKVMTWITLTRVQKLSTNQTHQEETIHCQSHNLSWKKMHDGHIQSISQYLHQVHI